MKIYKLRTILGGCWARKFLPIIFLFAVMAESALAQLKTLQGSVTSQDSIPFANTIEIYRVPWWGTEGSILSRPNYGVINIENGELALRHAILEGRILGDYRLPYFPIKSFVSIVSKSAELAHQGSVIFTFAGKTDTVPFCIGEEKYRDNLLGVERIEEGFELARVENADVLKITNRGSGSPILMEHFFVVYKESRAIPIFVRATNTSDQTIQNVAVRASYMQDFNWSCFGTNDSQYYQLLKASAKGTTKIFFAFSSGMERGYEFKQIIGCKLSYTVSLELNTWEVIIQNTPTTLAPGASVIFQYDLRVIDKPPLLNSENGSISKKELDNLVFKKIKPIVVKNAPHNFEGRVTINEVIRNLGKPKVRGLNLRTDFAHVFDDLATLKEWGGNLIITNIGNPEESKQVIGYGHKLSLEMFISGVGGYQSGIPPKFDRFFATNLKSTEYPDSYGQDEDHYYWFRVKPTLDFEADFGKPVSAATQEEKVIYWSRCFFNKWRMTLADVRKHDPGGNIWFYCPSPGVANIDPLDYYDLFFREISHLGDALTVFPFYYGVEFNQVEYMMHRWKQAGISRVVFLPMSDFMIKPSQFIRAITAARRGGSDGTCGFAFLVSKELSGKEWQWKSIMLGAQANFPTPELNAYCFIEEPAELIEGLALSDLEVYSSRSDTSGFLGRLEKLLPGHVQWINGKPEKPPTKDKINVVIGDILIPDDNKLVYDVHKLNPGAQKGVIQMSGTIVRLNGSDAIGVKNAENLFLRFAELVMAERNQ